jgi:hypothetical protein
MFLKMLFVFFREVRSSLVPAVAKVIEAELQESAKWGLEGLSRSAKDYNESFVTQHGGKSLLHAVSFCM